MNTILLILIFSIIYWLNFCNPVATLCGAFSTSLCMIVMYIIVEFLLECIISRNEATILINWVLIISSILLFIQRIIYFYNDMGDPKCVPTPIISIKTNECNCNKVIIQTK